jgi:acyl carrier protein
MKQLVAYVVTGPETAVSVDELRVYLKENLPYYMLPAAFMLLDSLPLTVNGKLDRAALPPLTGMLAERTNTYVPPEGPVEEKLAEIWADVLGVEHVGVFDTFFDLGGYSLLAAQVIHRINSFFGIRVPLRDLFEEPTIANLALLIEETILESIEQETNHG